MLKRSSHFFVLRPVPGAIRELGDARDRPGLRGVPVGDAHLHVTLFWLGYDDVQTPARVARACAAAAGLRAAPFRIVFDRLVAAQQRVLLLPGEALPHLQAFQQQLADALAVQGVSGDPGWRFHPHITLRRDASGWRDASERHDAARRSDAIDPIAWTVADFALIRSLPHPFRHEECGRWPLTPCRRQSAISPSSSPSQ